MLENIQSN